MDLNAATRLKSAWSIFRNRDPTIKIDAGQSYYYRPDRVKLTHGNERSFVGAIYNRIAMDVAAIDIKHCRVNEDGQFLEELDTPLNECLTLEANIDQSHRALKQDIVESCMQEGVVAVVPTVLDSEPKTDSFKIYSLRVGKIIQWYPKHVKVRLYNEETGNKEDVVLPKRLVAIIENPLYSIMNEPNSTVQRLVRKLSLLDAIDEQSGSGKLDLIIQLPYVIRNKSQVDQAERRRKSIEDQLAGSKYGIAYTDGTERITQLNRPVENNLMKQIEFLTDQVYSQLGLTPEIMNQTANEQTMLNYNNRTIEPFVSAITDEFKRKFLTQTARSQGQTIMAFRNPFKLTPLNNLAEIADKFTRNEIMTSNEFRQIIGIKPSDDPKADKLVNSNLNHPEEEAPAQENTPAEEAPIPDGE